MTGTLLAGSPLRADTEVEVVSARSLAARATSAPGAPQPGRLPLATPRAGRFQPDAWRPPALQLERPIGESSELRIRVQPKAKRLVVLELRF